MPLRTPSERYHPLLIKRVKTDALPRKPCIAFRLQKRTSRKMLSNSLQARTQCTTTGRSSSAAISSWIPSNVSWQWSSAPRKRSKPTSPTPIAYGERSASRNFFSRICGVLQKSAVSQGCRPTVKYCPGGQRSISVSE